MPYAAPQDMIDQLGEREARALSDRSGTGVVDEVALARLLAVAEDEANGHLSRRYAVPLSDASGQPAAAPATLKAVVIDIARYRGTGTEITVTEEIRSRYRDAVRWLEGVAEGRIALAGLALVAPGGPAPSGGAMAVRTGRKDFGDMSGVL